MSVVFSHFLAAVNGATHIFTHLILSPLERRLKFLTDDVTVQRSADYPDWLLLCFEFSRANKDQSRTLQGSLKSSSSISGVQSRSGGRSESVVTLAPPVLSKLPIKPGSHLWDKHNTNGISARKRNMSLFFLVISIMPISLAYS